MTSAFFPHMPRPITVTVIDFNMRCDTARSNLRVIHPRVDLKESRLTAVLSDLPKDTPLTLRAVQQPRRGQLAFVQADAGITLDVKAGNPPESISLGHIEEAKLAFGFLPVHGHEVASIRTMLSNLTRGFNHLQTDTDFAIQLIEKILSTWHMLVIDYSRPGTNTDYYNYARPFIEGRSKASLALVSSLKKIAQSGFSMA